MSEPLSSESARPYHERWQEILRYPLHSAALSTVIAIAVAHTLVLLLMVVGPLLDLLVWAAFFKYAFEVLRWSANGRDQPPEISLTVGDAVGRYAVMLLILIELAVILAAISFGTIGAMLFGLLVATVMPAMVMILAIDEDLVRALNPLAWVALMIRLGGTYFVLVGFFIAALFVQSVVVGVLRIALPGIIVDALVYFAVNYLMIANFHLIGWVIHEHADELGYSGHVELQERPAAEAGPDALIIDSARRRAASGDVEGAIALLRDEIAVRPDAVALHEEYRHWLKQNDAQSDLLANSRHYISALLAHNRDHVAMDVAREAHALDPGFALDKPELVTRLGAAAAAAGQSQLALDILGGFHKRFRNHADIARNYLLAAKIMAERMNRELQARALLQQIKVVLPNDPLIPEVDAYLAFLDKLAATPAKPAQLPAHAMTRWRAPQAASTAIITAEGYARLKAELDNLWRERRPEVVKALAAAAAEGDRSENAEYTYRKKQLGEIDRRVRYLSRRLETVKVVEQKPTDGKAVFFGAWLEVEDEAGSTQRFRIVGPDETDATRGWISIDSPLARAALKKRIDDEFDAELPGGRRHFVVVAVSYDEAL